MSTPTPPTEDRDPIALMIRQPWVDHILAGTKTWEIRGTNARVRGVIYLAASGTGTLLGCAELYDVKGPLTPEEFRSSANLHLTPNEELNGPLPYRKTYAWLFRHARRFPRPLRYRHPSGAITWVALKDFTPGQETFTGPWTIERQLFVESLAVDLRRLGHGIEVMRHGDQLRMAVQYQDEKFEDPQHVRAVYRSVAGNDEGAPLTSSQPIPVPQVADVKPEFRLCISEEDKERFEAARRVQQLPSTAVGGRYLRGILWDKAPSPPRVMGVIGLSGATYAVQSRDEFLQWKTGQSPAARTAKVEEGLRRILHLSVCAAAPPYNSLRVGKLLALLAFSSTVVNEYQRRWGDLLMAVTTTSAYGPHGSIYRRIRPNRIEPKSRYGGMTNHLFQRIGESRGEYFAIISEETRRLADAFLRAELPEARESAHKFGEEGVVKKAMMAANLPRDLLRFVKMGFFIGYLTDECLRVLQGLAFPLIAPSLEPDDCFNYWRTSILKAHPASSTSEQTPQNEPDV